MNRWCLSMQEKIEIKEHAENIAKAIQALMPSRNYIVQFLAMLPSDYPTIYEAFPELLRDEKTRKALESAFGISFGEQVKTQDHGKLGYILADFYDKIFKALEREDVRQGLAQLIESDDKNILNLNEEWLKLKLDGLAMEPNYGKEAIDVLKAVKIIGEEKNKQYPTYEVSVAKIADTVKVGEERIYQIIELLLKYKLVKKENVREDEKGKRVEKEGIIFVDSLKTYANLIEMVSK